VTTYRRKYDREVGGLMDPFMAVVLCLAILTIIACALWDEVTHPHGIPRAACEGGGGVWTKVGWRGQPAQDVMACRYRIPNRGSP
jgi:hypothetical protein